MENKDIISLIEELAHHLSDDGAICYYLREIAEQLKLGNR